MMCKPIPLLLLALSSALATGPTASLDNGLVIVPQKKAALVLDRLLVALQKALHEDSGQQRSVQTVREWPRAAPLRIGPDEIEEMDPYKRLVLEAMRKLALSDDSDETSRPTDNSNEDDYMDEKATRTTAAAAVVASIFLVQMLKTRRDDHSSHGGDTHLLL